MANGGTRGKAPELSRAQAARMDRWHHWNREMQRISREMMEATIAGDAERVKRLAAEHEANPEPDIFNG